MAEPSRLLQAFRGTQYQLPGHGGRTVEVLKEALAEVDGDRDSDTYGQGEIIEGFQSKMAGFLGKETAVFFPSGTMAQQIALRIWCDRSGVPKVAYHPLCHLEIHEQDGLKKLHGIVPVLLADKTRVITLDDVRTMPSDVSCLLLELPQREIGGQLPDYDELEAISVYCRERGIKLHLDGARLFEVLPHYGKTAAEICALFDSVYVSFYKGIGGIAGAILAGDPDFTQESVVWKRRHGGDLISLYPYILSADYYWERRVNKMRQYYEEAQELAQFYNRCPGVATVPQVPVSNMFHVHLDCPAEQAETVFVDVQQRTGVGFTGSVRPTGDASCYFEVSIGDQYEHIPTHIIEQAFADLRSTLGQRQKA